jgi:hypothetical protein
MTNIKENKGCYYYFQPKCCKTDRSIDQLKHHELDMVVILLVSLQFSVNAQIIIPTMVVKCPKISSFWW